MTAHTYSGHLVHPHLLPSALTPESILDWTCWSWSFQRFKDLISEISGWKWIIDYCAGVGLGSKAAQVHVGKHQGVSQLTCSCRWKLRAIAYTSFQCIIMALGGMEFLVGDAAGSYWSILTEDATQTFFPNKAVICKPLLKQLTVFSWIDIINTIFKKKFDKEWMFLEAGIAYWPHTSQ